MVLFCFFPTCLNALGLFPSVFSREKRRILPKFQEFPWHSWDTPKTRPRDWDAFLLFRHWFSFFFPPNSGTQSFLHLNKTQMDTLWILLRAKKCPYRFLRSWWDVGVIVRTARSSFSYMSWKIQSWVRKLGFSDLTELSFSFKKQVIIHLQTHLSLLCCQ